MNVYYHMFYECVNETSAFFHKNPLLAKGMKDYKFPENRSTNVTSVLTITPVPPFGPKHEF